MPNDMQKNKQNQNKLRLCQNLKMKLSFAIAASVEFLITPFFNGTALKATSET